MLQKTDETIMNSFGRLGCLKLFTMRIKYLTEGCQTNPFVGRIYGITSPPTL